MSHELAVIEDVSALAIQRDPEQVLEEAHKAAAALKRVIDAKPDKIMFGPQGKQKQYLTFEDWQTMGRFYGIAPRIVSSKPLTLEGGATGWEAVAEAIHVPTGRVVSSADAMCLNDEEKWSARPKYAWVYHKKSGGTSETDPGKDELIWEKGADGKSRPKKERMQIGVEQVPQFQLRSMAQTRAGAKALRNALAWVVVLAGYAPTPAEEMDDIAPSRPRAEDAVVMETTEQQATRLFPQEDELRTTLLSHIKLLIAEKRIPEKERGLLFVKSIGGAPLETADVAALADLETAVANWRAK